MAPREQQNILAELRKFQEEFAQAVSDIKSGASQAKLIVAHVVPGGGKSRLPTILKAAFPQRRICWAVPRITLRRQGARSFQSEWSRKFSGQRLSIREAGNEVDPSGDTDGYIITHQAIENDNGEHIKEFSRYDYILVIDEGHHLGILGATYAAFRPLVERASLTVIVTGLVDRSDKSQIGFLPYDHIGDREFRVARRSTTDVRWIEYGLRDALLERAIIPIYFTHVDGQAAYIDRTGQKQEVEELGDDNDALFTAVSTKLGEQILRAGVEDWLAYLRIYPGAKLLVVCARQREAKKFLNFLRNVLHINAEVAVSEDGARADGQIDLFRRGDVPCLVTVAKAYEGMDVPEISHLVCLTHIRAYGWIYQMLGRVWRVDYKAIIHGIPYQSQTGKVFVPNDNMMTNIIRTIEEIRDKALADRGDSPPTPPPPPSPPLGDLVPLSSHQTTIRGTEILGDEIPEGEWEFFHDMIIDEGLQGLINESQMRRLYLRSRTQEASQATERTGASMEPLTPREEEDATLLKINEYLLGYEYENGLDWGSSSLILIKEGWPPRDQLRGVRITQLWEHIHQRFPRQQETSE